MSIKDLQSISNAPIGAVPADVWTAVFAACYVKHLVIDSSPSSRRSIARVAFQLADNAVEDLAFERRRRSSEEPPK